MCQTRTRTWTRFGPGPDRSKSWCCASLLLLLHEAEHHRVFGVLWSSGTLTKCHKIEKCHAPIGDDVRITLNAKYASPGYLLKQASNMRAPGRNRDPGPESGVHPTSSPAAIFAWHHQISIQTWSDLIHLVIVGTALVVHREEMKVLGQNLVSIPWDLRSIILCRGDASH